MKRVLLAAAVAAALVGLGCGAMPPLTSPSDPAEATLQLVPAQAEQRYHLLNNVIICPDDNFDGGQSN